MSDAPAPDHTCVYAVYDFPRGIAPTRAERATEMREVAQTWLDMALDEYAAEHGIATVDRHLYDDSSRVDVTDESMEPIQFMMTARIVR